LVEEGVAFSRIVDGAGMIAYFKEHYQLTDAMLYQHLSALPSFLTGKCTITL